MDNERPGVGADRTCRLPAGELYTCSEMPEDIMEPSEPG